MEDQNNPNLLQEFEQEVLLERATVGQRFVNYLLDVLVFYVIIIIFGFIYGIAIVAQVASVDDSLLIEETGNAVFIQYLLSFILFVGYYTIFEGASKGRTVGKFATGTMVVKEDGSPITWTDAILRSLCRLIPFEPLSTFGGNPWHDSITKTTVVKVRR